MGFGTTLDDRCWLGYLSPSEVAAVNSKLTFVRLFTSSSHFLDCGPTEMLCREHIKRIVKNVFTSYGGSRLNTPVLQRKDLLMDKYGEDSKLT